MSYERSLSHFPFMTEDRNVRELLFVTESTTDFGTSRRTHTPLEGMGLLPVSLGRLSDRIRPVAQGSRVGRSPP